MNRRVVVGAIGIVLLLLLAVTVPDEESFATMLRTNARENSKGFFDSVAKAISATIQTHTVTYHNYVIFATAETHLGSSRSRYVGLLGNWFELD